MPIREAKLGEGVVIFYPDLVNLYRCSIGKETHIGPFVEIQSEVEIGEYCKISSHSFICSYVSIGDRVFIGHGVMFCNDRYPGIVREWKIEPIVVGSRASIGSGSVILPGVYIGEGSIIGAGSVVTKTVPPNYVAFGNPARLVRELEAEIEEHG